MSILNLLASGPRPLAASFSGWRSLGLDTGQRMRIADGPGVLVRATSGELWLTEEGMREDVVLREGDAYRVRGGGTTIVEAQRESRVVVEVAPDQRAPAAVELLPAPGHRGEPMPVPVAHPWRGRAARATWLGAAWRGNDRAA